MNDRKCEICNRLKSALELSTLFHPTKSFQWDICIECADKMNGENNMGKSALAPTLNPITNCNVCGVQVDSSNSIEITHSNIKLSICNDCKNDQFQKVQDAINQSSKNQPVNNASIYDNSPKPIPPPPDKPMKPDPLPPKELPNPIDAYDYHPALIPEDKEQGINETLKEFKEIAILKICKELINKTGSARKHKVKEIFLSHVDDENTFNDGLHNMQSDKLIRINEDHTIALSETAHQLINLQINLKNPTVTKINEIINSYKNLEATPENTIPQQEITQPLIQQPPVEKQPSSQPPQTQPPPIPNQPDEMTILKIIERLITTPSIKADIETTKTVFISQIPDSKRFYNAANILIAGDFIKIHEDHTISILQKGIDTIMNNTPPQTEIEKAPEGPTENKINEISPGQLTIMVVTQDIINNEQTPTIQEVATIYEELHPAEEFTSSLHSLIATKYISIEENKPSHENEITIERLGEFFLNGKDPDDEEIKQEINITMSIKEWRMFEEISKTINAASLQSDSGNDKVLAKVIQTIAEQIADSTK